MKKTIKLISFMMCLMLVFSVTGAYAMWVYNQSYVNRVSERLQITLPQWTDLPEQGITIANKFLNILNSEAGCDIEINGMTYTDSYDALIAAFNSSPKAWSNGKYVTLHNNSYIGSMQTKGDDAAALRTLFGDSLTSEEEASEDYSLMLKREALDGRNITGISYYMDGDHGWKEENNFYPGCEMVLFSTNWTSDATTPYGYVIVYATVYTRYPITDTNGNYVYDLDENGNIQYYTYTNASGTTVTTQYPIYQYGDWVKISGDNGFIGHAQVVNYSTGDSTRSFDTGSWRSSLTYNTAATGSTLAQVIQALPDTEQ